jgi:anti-sigma-K factor RskA
MTIPTLSADEKKEINAMIDEICDILPTLEAGRESIKDLKKSIREILPMTPKVLNRVIVARYKQNLAELAAEHQAVEDIMKTLT